MFDTKEAAIGEVWIDGGNACAIIDNMHLADGRVLSMGMRLVRADGTWLVGGIEGLADAAATAAFVEEFRKEPGKLKPSSFYKPTTMPQ